MAWSTGLAFLVGVLVVAFGLIYIAVVLLSHTPRPARESERTYVTLTGKSGEFSAHEKFTKQKLSFSLIIPCYNETKRLGKMLDEAVPILNREYPGHDYEIVLVDDGSKDGTAEFALEWATSHKLPRQVVKVCQLERNRGKGGAVTHGMRFAQGDLLLFADADGASKFDDIIKLRDAITSSSSAASVAIGSRAHMVNTDAVVKRSFIRNFLMYGLHTLVYVFGIRTIKDTQCGFKMFTKTAARAIFPYMHTEGWIFDVEVLMIALKKNLKVAEVPISWHEVDGSKVDLARDSILMAVDLVVTRMAYILGVYNEKSLTYTDSL